MTPSRAPRETQQSIVDAVARATRALGLRHGPVHAECRVNTRGVYVLEVAARPIGGLCSRAVRFAGPHGAEATLEEVLLRHALGESVTAFRPIENSTGVMMIPIPRRGVYRGVRGLDEARQVAGIDDVTITAKPDSTLVPLPEGRSYLGFIFAQALVSRCCRERASVGPFAPGVRHRPGGYAGPLSGASPDGDSTVPKLGDSTLFGLLWHVTRW